MNIIKEQNGAHFTISLEGRLDTVTAPELERELQGCLDSAEGLTIDLKKLDYISSAGLRVLLYAHKALYGKGGLKIKNASDIVMEVFDVTGFTDFLTFE